MNRPRLGFALAMLILGGCASMPRDTPGAAPSPTEPANAVRPPIPVQDAFSPLPEAFRFVVRAPQVWRVTADARRVVLEGASIRRELRVEISEPLFDGRNVVARDDEGSVEIRSTPRLCQDAATGDLWPYTVRLSIANEASLLGCGGPLDANPARADAMP